MATRMQQRRGTAAQWTQADPILAAGEIGFESDTGQFKIGDGINHWEELSYFKNLEDLGGDLDDYIPLTQKGANNGVATLTAQGQVASAQLTSLIDSASASYNTLGKIETEISGAGGVVAQKITVAEGNAAVDATTKANNAKTGAETTAAGYVSTHSADTTDVHGIANTADLVTLTGTQTLTGKTISAADNTVTVNAADIVDVTSSAAELNILDGATLTVTELNYVDGVTSAIQTQLDAKAPLADPTFTGTTTAAALNITGNLTVGGTTTTVNATDLAISDPLIYMSSGAWTTDIVDVGFLAATGEVGGTEEDHKHSGLFRDVSDSAKWKLVSNVPHPVSNTVDLTDAVYDTLKIGGVEFSDGVQVKQGVPSLTTINQQAAAYTTVLTDRDKLVEVSSATAVTVTIPTNSTVAYPVGTSIDILQTGVGQVTIAGAGGVTVNSTPGLKLRTQWSSATLFKRAENTWVVFGDLSA
jgi:hypothetical protein